MLCSRLVERLVGTCLATIVGNMGNKSNERDNQSAADATTKDADVIGSALFRCVSASLCISG